MKSSAALKTTAPEKLVYSFGDGKAEGSAAMKNTLGGKGANLADMCALGLPVPPRLHHPHGCLCRLLRR
jgi:hypothetical protein